MSDKLDLIVDRIDDVKDKVDEVSKDINDIKLDVAKNTYDLQYHIRRSDLNEQRLKIMEDRLSFNYLLKLTLSTATGLGAIAGALYSIFRVIALF